MATPKEARLRLRDLISQWLMAANADPNYDTPIEDAHVRAFKGAPPEGALTAVHVFTINPTSELFVIGGGDEISAKYGVMLFSRLSNGTNAEADQLAAENWLDDAETILTRQLVVHVDEMWSDSQVTNAGRDRSAPFFGDYRTALIVVDLQLEETPDEFQIIT